LTWIRDSLLYMIARGVPAAVGLLLAAALVRIIGTAEYGAYALAFAGTNLVSAFCVGWLTQATWRFQPASGEAAEAFHRVLNIGGLACSLACVLIVALLFTLSVPELQRWTAILAGGLLVFGLSTHAVFTASVQAAFRASEVAALEVGRAVISFPLACWLASVVHPGYVGAIAGIGLSYLSSGFAARILAARVSRQARDLSAVGAGGSSPLPWRVIVGYGWMMSVWLALSLSLPYLERMVLANRLDNQSLGVYSAIYDVIFRGCGFMMVPIVLALHPRILREGTSMDLAARVELWRKGILSQAGIAMIIVLSAWVLAPFVLQVIGIEASSTHVRLAILLAVSGCLWQIALMAHKLLEVTLSTLAMIVVLAISIAACILVDVIVAPRFGLVAVAGSLAASGLLYCVVVIVIGRARVARALAATAGG